LNKIFNALNTRTCRHASHKQRPYRLGPKRSCCSTYASRVNDRACHTRARQRSIPPRSKDNRGPLPGAVCDHNVPRRGRALSALAQYRSNFGSGTSARRLPQWCTTAQDLLLSSRVYTYLRPEISIPSIHKGQVHRRDEFLVLDQTKTESGSIPQWTFEIAFQ